VQAVEALPAGPAAAALTLWFDLPPAVAAQRLAGARVPDKFESQPLAFFERVAGRAMRTGRRPSRALPARAGRPAARGGLGPGPGRRPRQRVAAMTAPLDPGAGSPAAGQRGHAWLLQGPSGLGQYGLAWRWPGLAVRPADADGACGQCGSCHQVDVRTHADLCVLMPETAMQELGWPLSRRRRPTSTTRSARPAARSASRPCATRWNSPSAPARRGRGKVVLVYPAERMNTITANTLLKTLEEPPGTCASCWPAKPRTSCCPRSAAAAWATRCVGPSRRGAGLAGRAGRCRRRCARCCCARPAAGRKKRCAWHAAGPATPSLVAMAQGDGPRRRGGAGRLGPAQAIDILQKLCHDLLAVRAGAEPRFFEAGDLPPAAGPALGSWWR
jgi:DNA polymerase-3 subunit delta'